MANNSGLGRGLASLIPQKNNKGVTEPGEVGKAGENPPDNSAQNDQAGSLPVAPAVSAGDKNIQEIEIGNIIPNQHQPRLKFHEEKLKELANSIKEHGIIQPLI